MIQRRSRSWGSRLLPRWRVVLMSSHSTGSIHLFLGAVRAGGCCCCVNTVCSCSVVGTSCRHRAQLCLWCARPNGAVRESVRPCASSEGWRDANTAWCARPHCLSLSLSSTSRGRRLSHVPARACVTVLSCCLCRGLEGVFL